MASKSGQDPGWNDPPIFSYDKATAIQAAAADKKRTLLNKRVAFPISGNIGNGQNIQGGSTIGNDMSKPPSLLQPPLLPPPPTLQSSSPSSCNKLESLPSSDVKLSSTDRLETVLKNLQLESNCDEEILKRIKIMEKMWTEDKLEENVKSKILELSEALFKNDPETADHIQKGLMVDHVSQCSSWMSGIRHLINQKKK